MNLLITGATSKIGHLLLPELLRNGQLRKIYILTRNENKIGQLQLFADPRIELLLGDLNHDLGAILPATIDLCLHMAALTHSVDPEKYFETNLRGTENLAKTLVSKSCKKLVYISSQTAGIGAGAYGESKIESETILLKLPWKELIIIRPAEVLGMNSSEGIDKFDNLARNKKIFPWLLNFKTTNFSPFTVNHLIRFLLNSIWEKQEGQFIYILRGPLVTSTQLAKYYWQKYKSLPIPVFVPVLNFVNQFLSYLGKPLFPPDQILRLYGLRGQKPNPHIEIKEIIFESPFTK